MTDQEMLKTLQDKNPSKTFAIADQGNAIGMWSDGTGRFQTIASRTIIPGVEWALAFDVLANGKPVWTYQLALAGAGA